MEVLKMANMWRFFFLSFFFFSKKSQNALMNPQVCFQNLPKDRIIIDQQVLLTVLLFCSSCWCWDVHLETADHHLQSDAVGISEAFLRDRAFLSVRKDISVHVIDWYVFFSFFAAHIGSSWMEEEQMLKVKWGPQVTSCDRRWNCAIRPNLFHSTCNSLPLGSLCFQFWLHHSFSLVLDLCIHLRKHTPILSRTQTLNYSPLPVIMVNGPL